MVMRCGGGGVSGEQRILGANSSTLRVDGTKEKKKHKRKKKQKQESSGCLDREEDKGVSENVIYTKYISYKKKWPKDTSACMKKARVHFGYQCKIGKKNAERKKETSRLHEQEGEGVF